MKKIQTICDMASIKIYTKDVAFFFTNHMGDGYNEVRLLSKKEKPTGEFQGQFIIKTNAELAYSDCGEDSLHTFSKGRYFVYLIYTKYRGDPVSSCTFEIQSEDNEMGDKDDRI